ncbi:unnamed protein product [Calicophoron daubneyi]|uniref:carbonic anhydrase n=1 Tax=Calicophoron daubneyi TaxID=300641 RepID=A0AAV2TWS8_CALDB
MWNSLFILSLLSLNPLNASEGWSYTNQQSNPAKWSELGYRSASGPLQSPIDIRVDQSVVSPLLKPIRIFKNPDVNLEGSHYTLQNNGHSVKIKFPPNTWFVSFTGDNTKQFEVLQIHFHWGADDTRGSEHTVDGMAYPLESHLVSYNRLLYSNYSQAAKAPSGHAVLGFFHHIDNQVSSDNTQLGALGNMIAQLPAIIQPQTHTNISTFNLSRLLDHVDPAQYFRYSGSLTTPPCTENVIWTLFRKTVPVKSEQLELLRNLRFPNSEDVALMADNFRPVASINPTDVLVPRQVFRSDGYRENGSHFILLLFALKLTEKIFC